MRVVHNVPRVREFMTAAPLCIEPESSLGRARRRMAELDAHHLPVTRAGELVGLVSVHDLDALEITAGQRAASHCTVADAMKERPFTCGPDAHLHAVAAEMAVQHVDSAVIVDPKHPSHVLGVFTTTDALHALSVLVGHEHEVAAE
ncbi:MAG TPA: CBS domain-containing protein [Nannocystaceae bacterium]|nr:CBS domain-containing protein [Nannocystaceae bacterium]